MGVREVRFDAAIDVFVATMRQEGRIRSPHTESAYRAKLVLHAADVGNRDPSKTGREDVRTTLARWPHPNSRNQAHAILRSFYDFAMEEGWRRDNPARQIRTARKQRPDVLRLTRDETIRVLDASRRDRRDRWMAHLGILAGLRSQEIRLLQGRHLQRDGWVWVTADIAKGGVERFVPVIGELEPIVAEIRQLVAPDGYVLPGRRDARPPAGPMVETTQPQSASALYRRCVRLGEKAGVAGRMTPHALRRAFGDLVARYAGPRAAQVAMGHASIQTTVDTYLSGITLDELALAFSGLRVDMPQLPAENHPEMPRRQSNAR
jgi:integrase/recombinase XerD